MNWEVLFIILVPLAVWILGTIFRGAEEQRNKTRAASPDDGAALRVPRRPVNELDRFLEEARRRREAAQPSSSPRPQPVESPPSVPVVAKPRPVAPPPAPPRPERREERPARNREPEPSSRPLPQEQEQPNLPQVIPIRATLPRPKSPIFTQVAALLQERDALTTAFVLREILDRPLSLRRRER